MNNSKLKVSKKLIALLATGGIAFAPVEAVLGETKYIEGKFVKEIEKDETEEYGQYVVMEGDNLSKISEKICGHYHQEVSTKYWPALAFLNGYPRIIKPGDIIIYPKSFDRLVEMNNKLRKLGWTAKYIYNNKIYGGEKKKKVKLSTELVGVLLSDIYGDSVCVDPDFIRLYLQIQGIDDKYYLSTTQSLDQEAFYDLTNWIPTIEEIETFREENANKTKKK